MFRSFGEDLPLVIKEFNKFCLGEHPCYNGRNNFSLARFDGSKGSKNFIINPNCTGLIYRTHSLTETLFIAGTLERKEIVESIEDAFADQLDSNHDF